MRFARGRARDRRRHAGFSLIEVIIALTVLAVAMMLLARLSYLVSQRGRANDLVSKRNAALAQEASRFGVMSFANLATQSSGTSFMLIGDFSFNRVLTVTKPSPNRFTVKIVVSPLASEFRADSVTFSRTRPATGTPLCIGC